MTESFFGDKSKPPTVLELEKALGKSNSLLKTIEANLLEQFGAIEREWKFYSKKAGWTFALVYKGHRLLHLIPRSGFFTVVITLGMKAVLASRTIGLPSEILSAIENAREYAEGKSIRIDISSEKDVLPVTQLIAIKVHN
jgi:hypothetical protein